MGAMRLFAPGEATDVAVEQAAARPKGLARSEGPPPAPVTPAGEAFYSSAMRAAPERPPIAAAQNDAQPPRRMRPRPPVLRRGPRLGAWA
jgi:hypothetical protein